MTAEQPGAASSVGMGPRVHDIGPAGVVVVSADADDVRILGVEGTTVRVVSPADGAGLETRAEPGRFSVRPVRPGGLEKGGFVGIQVGSRGFGFPLRLRVSGTLELEVPRDARVEVEGRAGDVAVRDVRGGAAIRTASGDVSLKRVGGEVAIEATSGDVDVDADAAVGLAVRSVSGDVEARAPRFDRVAIETVSGDVELAGRLAPGPAHGISTVSGDVEVAVDGGLTLVAKTVSGRIEIHHPDGRGGVGRGRPVVLGDGAARLTVSSMSGDIEVRAGRARPGASGLPDAGPVPRAPDAPAPPATPRPPDPPPIPAQATRSATPSSDETQLAAAGRDAPPDPAVLAALEALARGEIDVAEAERRLAGRSPGREADRAAGADADG